MNIYRLLFKRLLLVALFFISYHSYSNVIWRTTSIGYSESFISSEMRNAANNTLAVSGSTFYDIDIDQNGTNDFRVNYRVDNMLGSTTACTEGLKTSNYKQFRWLLNKSATNTITGVYALGSTFGDILDGNTFWTDNVGTSSLNGLITYERRIYTPYPSALCMGMTEGTLTSNAPSNGSFGAGCPGSSCYTNDLLDFYIGVRFIRNGSVHMCWMKYSHGLITEIAWEDTPSASIRMGDSNTITSIQGKMQSSFKLYPNPAKSNFYIESAKLGSYSVLNLEGTLVATGELAIGINSVNTIQVLKQGSYIVRIKTDDNVTIERLIIQ